MRFQRGFNAPGDAGDSRLVKDKIRAGHPLLHGGGIGNVPLGELNPVPNAGQIFLPPGREIIQHPHAVAASHECVHKM